MAVPLLIFVVFLAALAAAGIAANVRRRRALTALAAANQWELTKNDPGLPNTFGGRPFATGHGRVARIVVRGRYNGRAILVVDYEFKTPGSNGDDTHHYWAACVEDLPAMLPAMEVVPRAARKSQTTGPGILLGAPEFHSGDYAFDQRYLVTTSNHQFTAAILDPKVRRLIASWPDFAWRIEGARLLTWTKGTMKPHWIQTSLNMLVALAEAFPNEIWPTAQGR